MSERDIIKKLVGMVEEMRKAQNEYFRQRNNVNLKKSKWKEDQVDEYVKHLHWHGYPPEETKSNNPNTLF